LLAPKFSNSNLALNIAPKAEKMHKTIEMPDTFQHEGTLNDFQHAKSTDIVSSSTAA